MAALAEGPERAVLASEMRILYLKGWSLRDLAGEFHISYSSVRRLLLEAGVFLRPRGDHQRLGRTGQETSC